MMNRYWISSRSHAVLSMAVFSVLWWAGCEGPPPATDGTSGDEQTSDNSRAASTTRDSKTGGLDKVASGNSSKVPPGPVILAGGGENQRKQSDGTAGAKSPAPVFRPADTRPRHDDKRLAQAGIFKYESKRLKLYTDVDPKIARSLPPLMDQAYEAWVEYFGPLPPNRKRTEYQLTGYIMADKALFKRLGLLPVDLPRFFHGRHRGAAFWMNDQTRDYYRRHLMIHEGTHCFMTTMPNTRAPVWYMEGMAELFGTHWFDKTGKAHFRIMPHSVEDFAGFGRIIMVQQDIKARGYRTLQQVTSIRPIDYLQTASYAWSWALCKFLDTHPRYRDRFRKLGRYTVDNQFKGVFQEMFDPDLPAIWTEWPVFATGLVHGYDFQRSAIDFREGKPLDDPGVSNRVQVAANRGWQSSGIRVEQGQSYEVTASGKFAVAQKPIPWVSEPNGISFRFHSGRPLGLLVAAVRASPPSGDSGRETMVQVIPIGKQRRIVSKSTGTLYFRINDFPSELADNTGKADVIVRKAGL